MAGPMVGPLLERLGIDLVETYWEPDGHFPDHEPNPLLEENRRFIVDKVRETGADLGIAWDGDADRCFFIDDTGAFVDGDFLTAILAEHLLAKQPGAAILYDVRASRAVPDSSSARGGVAHATVSATPSSRPACATRARSSAARSPATTTSTTSTTPTPGRSRRCSCSRSSPSRASGSASCSSPTARRYFISGEINSEVADGDGEDGARSRSATRDARISHLDGVSVDYDDWHFNVRPSNTEPLLRLCLESLVSQEDMERRRDEVLALIRS